MKFSIKDFFTKCDQSRSFLDMSLHKKRKLRIWSHLLKKSLMENFIFCAVKYTAHEPHISVLRWVSFNFLMVHSEMFGPHFFIFVVLPFFSLILTKDSSILSCVSKSIFPYQPPFQISIILIPVQLFSTFYPSSPLFRFLELVGNLEYLN